MQRQVEGKDDLGYLDLNSCLSSVEATPHYVVRHDGGEWLRINYDSGAATTVIPSEVVVHEVALEEAGEFVVNIPRFGRVRLPMTDEKGNARSVSATVAGQTFGFCCGHRSCKAEWGPGAGALWMDENLS